jgi:hypothetical protein
MTIDSTTRELIADCLSRIGRGDPCAALDLASVFMSHADSKDIALNLALVEGLAVLAKKQGCADANVFLQGQWTDMQSILRKRWERAGFV